MIQWLYMVNSVFISHVFEKKKSLEQLIEESKADSDFYLFLSISAIISTLGLLANNSVVVIGGMLVAPLLYPILFLSMATATSSRDGIVRAVNILGKSIILVAAISIVTSFLFHSGEITSEILLRTKPDLIAFLIAFFAGIAASFGWVKNSGVSSSLAGIAVSVSLVPPLATFGIGVASLDKLIVSGAITLFIINLLGIVLAGIIIFALFGFSNLQATEEKKIKEEKVEEVIRKKAVAFEKEHGSEVEELLREGESETTVQDKINQDNARDI